MASSAHSALLLLVLAVACVAPGALAATFSVGDNQLWSIPSSPSYYTDWASRQTFAVGDTLVFNFNTGAHDVVEVTRANYDACNAANPIATYSTGPASVELTAAGTKYFICGVNGHCSAGQKMSVAVAAAATSAPPPSPVGRPTTPPPTSASPPTSSARGPSASSPGVPGAAPSTSLGTAAAAATVGLTAVMAALTL